MSVSRLDYIALQFMKGYGVCTDLVPQDVTDLDGDTLRYRVLELDRSGRIKVVRGAPVSRRASLRLRADDAETMRRMLAGTHLDEEDWDE